MKERFPQFVERGEFVMVNGFEAKRNVFTASMTHAAWVWGFDGLNKKVRIPHFSAVRFIWIAERELP
jgi:hypothetical protein